MALLEPEFGLVFWMLLVFLLMLGILAKFAWPVILKSMESRAAFIEQGVTYTREAIERKKLAEQEAKSLIEEARKRQLELLQEAKKTSQEMVDEARQAALDEAQKVLDAAKLSVEQMKKEAESQLRREVGKLSLEIAEKVIRKDLDTDAAQREMVEKFLNDMEQVN
ncbi:MAG: F0F1 ATP synthase subunit B [Culturomica sp.]|jgi:F-type H+-transporting ATPase subunit b|nr:F0F1 ATP synthase subunit B [Culturomica sp.]